MGQEPYLPLVLSARASNATLVGKPQLVHTRNETMGSDLYWQHQGHHGIFLSENKVRKGCGTRPPADRCFSASITSQSF